MKVAVPSSVSQDEEGKLDLDFFIVETNLSVNRLKKLSSAWTLNTTPNFTQYRQKTDFLDNNINLTGNAFNLPLELTYRKDRYLKTYMGFSGTVSRTDLNLWVPRPPREDDPFYDIETSPKIRRNGQIMSHEEAAWFSVDYQLDQNWGISPGMRVFYQEAMKKAGADPRFNVQYVLSPTHKLKGAVGQYSQAPGPDQTDESFGNPDLDYKKSIHYVGGIESNWQNSWTTEVQLFHKKFFHMVKPDNEKGYNNEGGGFSRGAELFIRRNLTSRLFGWTSYTWSINRQQDRDDLDLYPSTYDQTHVLHIVGDYRWGPTWSSGGRFLFRSGNTYTPITDSVYYTNLDKYLPRYDEQNKNSARLPLERSLSIFINKDLLYETWTFRLRTGVEGIALGERVSQITYNYDYSKERMIHSLAFIPYIELRAIL